MEEKETTHILSCLIDMRIIYLLWYFEIGYLIGILERLIRKQNEKHKKS
jgi:hypothetical protein